MKRDAEFLQCYLQELNQKSEPHVSQLRLSLPLLNTQEAWNLQTC